MEEKDKARFIVNTKKQIANGFNNKIWAEKLANAYKKSEKRFS